MGVLEQPISVAEAEAEAEKRETEFETKENGINLCDGRNGVVSEEEIISFLRDTTCGGTPSRAAPLR